MIGRVAGVVRYPVKSMAGEQVSCARLTADGMANDRLYAFESTGAPAGMLRLTGRERREMLRYRPRMAGGGVEVSTPTGESFGVESAELLEYLHGHVPGVSRLTLTRDEVPQTDVRPLSILSVQMVRRLSEEMGVELDARRFRANLYLDLDSGPDPAADGPGEDGLVGRRLRVGGAVLLVRERTPRCRFVTYEPDAADTAEPLFGLMKLLDQRHQGRVGVYASVVETGEVAVGDAVEVLDRD